VATTATAMRFNRIRFLMLSSFCGLRAIPSRGALRASNRRLVHEC